MNISGCSKPTYRQKAIDGVLDNFKRFKSFCFMSATPILPSFKPNCLADVREIQADWENSLEKLTVELQQTNKPYALTANIINAYKRDGFITSEEGILDLNLKISHELKLGNNIVNIFITKEIPEHIIICSN